MYTTSSTSSVQVVYQFIPGRAVPYRFYYCGSGGIVPASYLDRRNYRLTLQGLRGLPLLLACYIYSIGGKQLGKAFVLYAIFCYCILGYVPALSVAAS